MRYPNVTSLYFATPLAFNALEGAVPWDDLRKILHRGQRMTKVQNGKEILPKGKSLTRARKRYGRQRDDKRIYDSNDPNVT